MHEELPTLSKTVYPRPADSIGPSGKLTEEWTDFALKDGILCRLPKRLDLH